MHNSEYMFDNTGLREIKEMSLQSSKHITLVLVVLVLSAASAFAKNERKLAITNDAWVSGKMLRAGKYKVGWLSQGPGATVTFYSGKEAVTTVEGKWVYRGSDQPDGSKSIVEIRFAGMSRALVLGSEAGAS